MSMKTLSFSLTMHFRADACLRLVFHDSGGRRHTEERWFISDWNQSYYNNRKEMNQEVTEYNFRLDSIPSHWEIDLTQSKIEFGWADRRSCSYWTENSPFRTDYLYEILNREPH